LSASLTDNVRNVREGNRDYLVAPVTMIVPGDLPGSKGPLLYEESELLKSVPLWDNVPITLDHPQREGSYVLANTEGVLETSGLGFVRSPKFDKSLKAEAWFDVLDVKRIKPDLLDSIRAGKKLELSTGLITQDFMKSGVDSIGREYK